MSVGSACASVLTGPVVDGSGVPLAMEGGSIPLHFEPERLALVTVEISLLLIAAVLAIRLTSRIGIPALLIFLGMGMLLSETARGSLVDDPALAVDLGFAALAVILAEGGLTTQWRRMRPVIGVAVVLATAGVVASAFLVAGVALVAFDMDLRTALLLGTIVSSTDAAAVFSTLRSLRVRSRLVATLEAESGMNDAPVAILVSLLASESFAELTLSGLLLAVCYELIVGALLGFLVGRAGAWVMRRVALPIAGLYPLATVAWALLAFGVGLVAGASGFMAVYVAAVVLGNSSLPHRRATLGFAQAIAWLAQILLFVLLGLLVDIAELPSVLMPALLVGLALLLLARPVSVVLSTLWFRFAPREMAFLSWAGLRGAMPIVFALIPMAEGFADGERLFYLVFVLVVVFTLVQGWTLPPVARALGVTEPTAATDIDVDAAPLEELGADLLQTRVTPASRLHGVYLSELRLPRGATVSLVVRDGEPLTPESTLRLMRGDELLVVAPAGTRGEVEARLRAVSKGGQLARWIPPDPEPDRPRDGRDARDARDEPG